MSTFQIGLVVVFALGTIIGMLMFSGKIPTPGGKDTAGITGRVAMWGTIRYEDMRDVIEAISKENEQLTLIYTYHNPNTINQEFIEALASGIGPDLLLVSNATFSRFTDKLLVVPYVNFPERTYMDTFVRGAEIFLNKEGIIAMPIAVNPLVLYYNVSTLESNGIAQAPKYWDEIAAFVPKLTKKDAALNILESTIGFGSFDNVTHAKDIVSLLVMQTGNSIVGTDKNIYLKAVDAQGEYKASRALSFFNQFGDPSNAAYSWNRVLPNTKQFFISGKSAFYLGYADELFEIQNKNPNLDFDIAMVPQARSSPVLSFGNILGVSIVKSSKNPSSAFLVSQSLSGPMYADQIAKKLSLAPVRRDLVVKPASSPYLQIFFNSALVARAWPDPYPEKTDEIFKDIIDGSNTGRYRTGTDMINELEGRLRLLIKK